MHTRRVADLVTCSRQSLVPARWSACGGYTCRPPGWATRQTQGSPLPGVPDMHSARAGPKPLAGGGGQVYLEDESSSWVGLVGGGGADWTSDRPCWSGAGRGGPTWLHRSGGARALVSP